MGSSTSKTQSTTNSNSSTNGTVADTGNTTQTASSQPWAQSLPFLQSILQAGGNLANVPSATDPTYGYAPNFANNVLQGQGAPGYDRSGYVTRALGGLQDAYGNLQGANNNYQGSIGDYSNALNSYKGNYNTYQGQLQPYLDPNYTDPTKVPGIAAALETIRNDVSNNIQGTFAGAGRETTGNGLGNQNIARGIAQGEAPVLLNEYDQLANRQRGAQDSLFGAGGNIFQGAGALDNARGNRFAASNNVFNAGNTVANAGNTAAQLLSGFAQQGLQNQLLGLGAVQSAQGLPTNYLQGLTKIAAPIASLGQTSTGNTISDLLKTIGINTTGTSNTQGTTTGTPSLLQDITGIGGLFSSGAGGTSAASGIGSALSGLGAILPF